MARPIRGCCGVRRQRDLLDRFGGRELAADRDAYRQSFDAWRAAERELRELVEHRQDRDREAALLRHGIEEIAAVAPVSGEDEALKAQATVLAHSTDLIAEIGAARALLVGDDAGSPSAVDLASQARRAVERASQLDPTLLGRLADLDGVLASVDEVARELGDYATGVDADPQQQAAVEERRQQISGLKRRYGPGLDDVLAWWAAAEVTVGQSDGAEARIDELSALTSELAAATMTAAARLTKARMGAAADFAAGVTGELHALAMPDAELSVAIETADDIQRFTADGADAVAMLLKPHAGSDPRPLAKGASGGELSRIMLAIEVVLAGVNTVPTFVFDEVDAGIGGKVAVEVGRRLARLARTAQVIVVTHLPQVAAFADRHVVVSKDRDGRVTAASVATVDGQERVHELVRMLSGLEGSQSGAEHAAELLALAAGERA
jgi:DNA repair protein RecN (Recombination protein N)